MRDGAPGLAIELGTVLGSEYDDDGFLGLQIDPMANDPASAVASTIESHTPYGFFCRPPETERDGNGTVIMGARAMFTRDGAEQHAWPLEDPRIVALLPAAKPGESGFHGPTSNFIRCHQDGRVSMYTTHDGTPNGFTIMRGVDPDDQLGGIVDFSPWGSTRLNATGFHVNTVGGAYLDMGGIGGFPAPVSSEIGSYFIAEADSVALRAKAVSLGPGPSWDNVVLATPIAGIVTALQDILASLSKTLLVSVANGKPVDSGDFVKALATFNTTVAPLVVAMRAQSTGAS